MAISTGCRPAGAGPAEAAGAAGAPGTAGVRRAPLRLELAVLGALYAGYTAVRALAVPDPARAVANAHDLLAVQDALGLSVERAANAWASGVPALAVACCYAYATLHYVVTPLVLLHLRRAGGSRYEPARDTLVLASVLGLVGFVLVPLAPPRLAGAGYVDTLAAYSAWGWWSDAASAPRGLGALTNQYAAMPSLHVGWALWCALALHPLLGRRARALAWCYPAVTAAVVVLTGNHYVLDAVAGAAVVLVACGTVALRDRRRRRRSAVPAEPAAPPGAGGYASAP